MGVKGFERQPRCTGSTYTITATGLASERSATIVRFAEGAPLAADTVDARTVRVVRADNSILTTAAGVGRHHLCLALRNPGLESRLPQCYCRIFSTGSIPIARRGEDALGGHDNKAMDPSGVEASAQPFGTPRCVGNVKKKARCSGCGRFRRRRWIGCRRGRRP
eukprot:scaffold37642_cov30-Tisochrysis_lutea.AAC.5